MADDRKRKDGGEPVLEFFWDSLELAADQTYSTTLRIKLTGWWEGGKPREVGVSVYEKGQEPPAGSAVRIQKGFGTFPLIGLLPGHHYLVITYIGERLPVQKMILVPELPKPEKPKAPKNLLVSVSGMPGKQKLLISIAAEDGTFIPNQLFTIVDGDRVASRKTGRKGVATYKVNFAEHSRYFEVRAGNTEDLVWQEQVPGPAKRIRPEFRQTPAPPDYSQMGREAARRHFRKPQQGTITR